MAGEPDTLRTKATVVFLAWLEAREQGSAGLFGELLGRHQELASELESLRIAHEELGEARPAPSQEKRPPHLSEGRRLGDFRILREIGRGGMGIVFEAEQISLNRRVALKILPAQLTLNERALTRFRNEAEITARLNHRGIVDVHQVGEADGIHFIAMELVEGAPLDQVIERMRSESFEKIRQGKLADVVSIHGLASSDGPERPSSVSTPRPGSKRGSSATNKNYIESSVRLICQVADALQHAHEAGVVHRDIKPANILLRPDGNAVLTDFGLAREEGLPSVSATGEFAGTPNYVSPEQAMAGRASVDHRSDVFSLGATLYELVTLELAFPGSNPIEVFGRIVSKPPVEPQKHNPILAPDLVTVILKALEKDPDRRYSSAREFAEDLRAFIEYRPIKAKRIATLSKAWRWVQREPLRATICGLLIVGLPLVGWLFAEIDAVRNLARASALENRLARIPDQINEGFLLLQTDSPAPALVVFEDVLALAPETSLARCGRLLSLVALGRREEAFLALDEDARIPDRLRVDVLRASGRNREATELEEHIDPPKEPFEHYLQALWLLRRVPRAWEALDRPLFARTDPGGAARVLRTGPADPRGRYHESAREAIRHLNHAIGVDGPLASYCFALAWAAWVVRDESLARTQVEAIEKHWNDNAVARYYQALATEVFDEEGALSILAGIGEGNPELLPALERRAAILVQRGAVDDAIRLLESALESRRAPSTLVRLADALWWAERYEDAVLVCNDAIALDPTLLAPYDFRGRAYFATGQLGEARRSFLEAMKFEESAKLQNDLGFIETEAGNLEDAIAHLERAIELDPEYPYPYFNLGVVEKRRSSFARAIELLERALELASDADFPLFPFAKLHASLGNCYEASNDGPRAARAYEQVIELDPSDLHAYLVLANVFNQWEQQDSNAEPGRATSTLRRALGAGLEPFGLEQLVARTPDPFFFRHLAEALELEGRRGEAIEMAWRSVSEAEERGLRQAVETLEAYAVALEASED